MVPGFTDTECRIAEFRSREMQAHAERQRMGAHVRMPRAEQEGFAALSHRAMDALARRVGSRLHGILAASGHSTARTSALGASR
ncbi:MAG: hypothetical protein K0S78_6089 [Thermomicrobiales bacterium]|jgi:hypothetical protein|nr:hypothetical protein [Thermomicrobiales bacterium]